jgi:hypothetical protein
VPLKETVAIERFIYNSQDWRSLQATAFLNGLIIKGALLLSNQSVPTG